MRELHAAWHEHGGRHRRGHDAIAPADIHLARRIHDLPTQEAHDSQKLRMLLDPEARKAERLKYQQKVEVAEAAYVAKHAKTGGGDRRQAPEQPRPQEAKPEHVPPENRDRPVSKLAKKWDSSEGQQEERRKPERSWLPRADLVKAISDIGMFATSISVAIGAVPSKWDAVAACAVSAVVSNVALANRRWKDKHGDRSEG